MWEKTYTERFSLQNFKTENYDMSLTASVCMHTQSVTFVLLFVTPWTVALQASLFTEFARQEFWS